MSYQRALGQNGGHFYSNITQPGRIDLSFIVNSSDSAGLGITSLKSNGYVENVFMHTSATPGTNNGHLNPNPAVGIALIQFKNNYKVFLGSQYTIQSPVTGGSLTTTVANVAYQIVTVGTTTTAQWVAKGLPVGVTPAAGVSFVAIASGALGGTGTFKALGVSGISSMEIMGSTILSNNSSIAANSGVYMMVQFLGATSSSVTTLIPTAPADTCVIGMQAFFDISSVTIDGL